MKLALQSLLFAIGVQTALGQYWFDYFSNYNNQCSGSAVTCSNLPAYDCCELNEWYLFYPTIQIGSYGPAGFVVFTYTDDYGSTCGNCQFTDPFGCFNNENPFNTAFVVGVSPRCGSSTKVRSIEEMEERSGNSTAIVTDPVCQNSHRPDTATVNGQNYSITDENRKEIMGDLLSLDPTAFAAKWQSHHRGPSPRTLAAPLPAGAKGNIS